MLRDQRIEKIKTIMLQERNIDVATLSDKTGVSQVTIRKDLEMLDQEGFLIKTHGGAVLSEKEMLNTLGHSDRNISQVEAKEKIAKLAVRLIQDGDSVFLSAGSTCYLLSQQFATKSHLRVVTNNVNAIQPLFSHVQNVMIIGGDVSEKDGMFAVGDTTYNFMDDIYVNIAFISVDGVDLDGGFTVNDRQKVQLFKYLKSKAEKIVILADSAKFNKREMYRLGDIDFAHCVVSDEKIEAKYLESFFSNNIKALTSYDF